MEFVTKTVKEVYDALEKNGFGHARSIWFTDFDKDKPTACILGQGALNLGVFGFNPDEDGWYFGEELDDNFDYEKLENYTIMGQLDRWNVPDNSKWSKIGEFDFSRGLGSTIIYWNDKVKTGSEWNELTQEYGEPEYFLKTYQEVIDMAHDVLSPHFDKTVKLAVYEHKFKVPA